jgi:NADH pyrophosphatase NudC (nudix superfamily)
MSEPKFSPKRGQVDYTNIRYAPVVNTLLVKDNKILLVKRSNKLRLYPNFWNGISGFLDDSKSIEEKVIEELGEELSLKPAEISEIRIGRPFIQEAPEYKKTWLVVPVMAKVARDNFRLDWEAQEAKWFAPKEAYELKLMPGFDKVLKEFYP